jgi:predicted Zn finger-like uncharacterized protein
MIVQCENCERKFRLDDSLIPEGGRKVKCSKCEYVFFIQKSSTAESAEDIVLPEEIAPKKTELEAELEDLTAEEEAPTAPQPKMEEFEPTVKIDLADQEELDFEEEEPITDFEDEELLPPRKAVLRPVLKVIFVAVIVAVAAWLVWNQRDRLPFLSALSEATTDNLIIERSELVGKWEKDGQIFVMMGTVLNQSKKPRAYIKIRGTLLDPNGKTVKETWAYCGNPIPTEDLLTKDSGEIQKQMRNREGAQGLNKSIAPNASIPFTVVFHGRPEGVESFGAEVVDAVIPESS